MLNAVAAGTGAETFEGRDGLSGDAGAVEGLLPVVRGEGLVLGVVEVEAPVGLQGEDGILDALEVGLEFWGYERKASPKIAPVTEPAAFKVMVTADPTGKERGKK